MEYQERTAPRPVRRRRRRKPLWPLYLLNIVLAILVVVLLVKLQSQEEPALVTPADASTYPADNLPPVIRGVRDLTVEAGGTLSYLEGITVTDDRDTTPQIRVDNSQVNLTVPGTYTVTYEAWDDAGNKAFADATVTVSEKEPEKVTISQLDGEIQQILDTILTASMTKEEQVRSIYDWCRENLNYGGHTTRGHYAQGAYEMLTTRQGDCYGYFCLSKAMFEYLGIDNLDVEKKKRSSSDSEHFWSLVSLDGGDTWYHFDATPRVGQTEDLCLVTDTFLDSFDTYHDGCHNRDKSAYPATPEGW